MALTTPDQVTFTPVDTGGLLATAPADAIVDNIFIYPSAESPTGKVRRVIDGAYRASWAGVFSGGVAATNATRLNSILANASVKEVIFDTPQGGGIPLSGTITGQSKTITLNDGSYFTGTYTFADISLNASYYQLVFDGNPTVTSLVSATGKFSTAWWGVVADGNDINAKLSLSVAAATASTQKILVIPPASSQYLLSTPITLADNIVLSFNDGAVFNCTAALTGGILDASYRQQIFSVTSIVSPRGFSNEMASVMWFGARGTGSVNDLPACQATVDMINRNRTNMTICYFPGGVYRMDGSLKMMLFNADLNRYEQVYVMLKGEGDGFSSKFPSRGTRLIFTQKDVPGLAWQIGKSGGAQSLSIEGPYVPPALTAAQFYNADLSTYGDPTCRDTRYSPLAGIAVDAVRYDGVPPDGGYPGFNYNAPGNNNSSGSSGLLFSDLKISGFTVDMIFSPNGRTQNDDGITVENIKVENAKVGFASCQDQEKGNRFNGVISWGVIHTLFDNVTYGAGTSGHIDINGANLAGQNNQFINWSVGGRFAPSIRSIYSEALGKFGTITTTASVVSISDCVWRWVYTVERGGYYSNWHIRANSGIIFTGCSFMIYGQQEPTIIANIGPNDSGPVFDNCYFENYPCQWVEQAQGNAIFRNCVYGNSRFGGTSNLVATPSSMKTWLAYGSFNVNDNTTNPTNNLTGKKYFQINSNYVYNRVNTGNSIAVVVNADRTASVTLTTSNVQYHKVNTPVYFGTVFAGLVASIDAGTGVLNLKYLNKDIVDGSYSIYAMCANYLYSFMGNTTNSSNQITACRADNEIGVAVGDVIFHPCFGGNGSSIVTGISGSLTTAPGATLTMSNNASYTYNGVYFIPYGVTKKFINPSFNSNFTSAFSNTTIFPAGSVLESNVLGQQFTYTTAKTGFINAAGVGGGETRQAVVGVTSLPSVIDRFVPGDANKPANGATSYQNDMLRGAALTDFKMWFGNDMMYPGLSGLLSYTFNSATGTITITNGTFDINLPVTIGS